MIIRQEQLLALELHAVQAFVCRMEKRLRSLFPKQIALADPSEVRSRIQASIEVAKQFALTRECDVEGYLIVMCASSADLCAKPPEWMLQILSDAGITPEDKIDLLYRACEDQQRGR